MRRFRPDILMVAAGFDGHRDDPVGRLCLDDADYFWIARALRQLADECCGGRLVASLEGGYNLENLGRSVASFVAGLYGQPPTDIF